MTPEGKVKAAVNKVLSKYKSLYRYMPVPGGFGASSLDYIICFRGVFISVETKAPGKKPTDRQKQVIGQIERAGGYALVIDGPDGVAELDVLLQELSHDPDLA